MIDQYLWLSTINVALDGAEAGESEQSEAAVVMQMLYDGGRLLW